MRATPPPALRSMALLWTKVSQPERRSAFKHIVCCESRAHRGCGISYNIVFMLWFETLGSNGERHGDPGGGERVYSFTVT